MSHVSPREPRRWTGEVGVVLKQPEVAAIKPQQSVFRFQNVSGGLSHLESDGRIVCSVSHSNGLVMHCLHSPAPANLMHMCIILWYFLWKACTPRLRSIAWGVNYSWPCTCLLCNTIPRAEFNKFTVKLSPTPGVSWTCHWSEQPTASKADECPLGAFTAAVMDLICASNCRPDAWHAGHPSSSYQWFQWWSWGVPFGPCCAKEHAVSQQLWSRALRFHRSETGETFANVPSSTGAAWLSLGQNIMADSVLWL